MVRTTTRILLISAAVGVLAGLAAFAFDWACQAVTHFSLVTIAGYNQGAAHGEAEFFANLRPELPGEGSPTLWLLIVVPTVGGLLTGLIASWLAPETTGHGTDAAIAAYHHHRGLIRPRVPAVKLVTSAITMGSGGSGGREGPIAQIGAGIGSLLGISLGLSDRDRRILLASGVGAGIGAIFHAPLAGALFATEVLYREVEFEPEVLIPAFISTTLAYTMYNLVLTFLGQSWLGLGHFEPFAHLLWVRPGIRFHDARLLGPVTILTLVMVGASWAYVRCFYGVHHLFDRMKLRKWVKPALGAALTGTFAVALYLTLGRIFPGGANDLLGVLSFGYGVLQRTLESPDGTTLILPVLVAVSLGKILTTSLTISSGGSGGTFGPMVVIGGTLGAAVGLVFHWITPGVVDRVDVFVILGIAAFFAACAKTPVSAIMIVSEMTGSYELLLPAMWVCALAYMLSRRWTMFVEQLPRRMDSPAHREDFIIDVLQGMTVREALDGQPRQFVSIPLDMPLREVARVITQTRQACFPVVNAEGRYQGLVSVDDVRQFLYDPDAGELAVAHDLETAAASPDAQPLASDSDLAGAIQRFATSRFPELPVVDPRQPDRVVAMIRRQDVIAAYNSRLLRFRGGSSGGGSGGNTTAPSNTTAPVPPPDTQPGTGPAAREIPATGALPLPP